MHRKLVFSYFCPKYAESSQFHGSALSDEEYFQFFSLSNDPIYPLSQLYTHVTDLIQYDLFKESKKKFGFNIVEKNLLLTMKAFVGIYNHSPSSPLHPQFSR